MKLYNTRTRQIEKLKPKSGNIIKMYTCGPTVYHFAHIGNLRTYISEDILEKGLKYLGYDVQRVMNITDVGHLVGDGDTGEDKMLVAAKREHKTSMEIAKYYTDCFFSDCKKLGIRKPDVVTPATDHIPMYIKMIEKLLKDGYAYIANGNVYYDTSKFSKYYELSGRNKDDLLVAVRNDIEEDNSKRNPFDFGLWFTNSKFNNQELKWDSPWGVGYPGWHIECSGISIEKLGNYLDIHCGAEDAVFPHHTNEIAQSEAYLGHNWCDFWVHMGFLNDKGGKMSKSRGEFLTVSLLEEKGYNPLSYRYLCLNSYYHNQLTFSYEILDGAENAYLKLKRKIASIKDKGELNNDKITSYINKFKEEISNDLNSSNMITLLYYVLKDEELSGKSKLYLVEDFDKVLSLDLISNDEENSQDDSWIIVKIEERRKAKEAKDYQKADAIRDELLEQGITLKDGRDGTTFERK